MNDTEMPGRLREGQVFHLCEDMTAVALPTCYNQNRGLEYRLDHFGDLSKAPSGTLLPVSTDDEFVVEEAYGSITGWLVVAWRESDNTYIHLHQQLSGAQWQELRLGTISRGPSPTYPYIAICRVGWPSPSPQSLYWAVHAIVGDVMPVRARWSDCQHIAKLPLGQGIAAAIALMNTYLIEDPAAALVERGFLIPVPK